MNETRQALFRPLGKINLKREVFPVDLDYSAKHGIKPTPERAGASLFSKMLILG